MWSAIGWSNYRVLSAPRSIILLVSLNCCDRYLLTIRQDFVSGISGTAANGHSDSFQARTMYRIAPLSKISAAYFTSFCQLARLNRMKMNPALASNAGRG